MAPSQKILPDDPDIEILSLWGTYLGGQGLGGTPQELTSEIPAATAEILGRQTITLNQGHSDQAAKKLGIPSGDETQPLFEFMYGDKLGAPKSPFRALGDAAEKFGAEPLGKYLAQDFFTRPLLRVLQQEPGILKDLCAKGTRYTEAARAVDGRLVAEREILPLWQGHQKLDFAQRTTFWRCDLPPTGDGRLLHTMALCLDSNDDTPKAAALSLLYDLAAQVHYDDSLYSQVTNQLRREGETSLPEEFVDKAAAFHVAHDAFRIGASRLAEQPDIVAAHIRNVIAIEQSSIVPPAPTGGLYILETMAGHVNRGAALEPKDAQMFTQLAHLFDQAALAEGYPELGELGCPNLQTYVEGEREKEGGHEISLTEH